MAAKSAGIIQWEWAHFWTWFKTLSSEQKADALALIDFKNMIALNPEQQVEVFRHAPEELLLSMKHMPHVFHMKTILLLQAERDAFDRKMQKYGREIKRKKR